MAENEAVTNDSIKEDDSFIREDETVMEEAEFSIDDTYEEGEGEEVGTQTYTDVPVPRPNLSQKKNRAINTSIQASSTGNDPVAAYREAFVSDDFDIFATASANTRTAVLNQLEGISKAGQPVDPTGAAKVVTDIQKRSQDTILGAFYSYVDSLPQASLLSPDERDEAAYHLYLQNTQARIWDDMSWSEVGGDILSMMAAPDQNLRMGGLADYLGIEFEGQNYFDSTEFQAKIFAAIGKMPVKQRAMLIKDMTDNWESFGVFDNQVQAIEFLSRSSSFTDEEKAWSHFEEMMDKVDQVAIVSKVGTVVAKGIAKTGNLLRTTIRLKDVEGARVAAKSAMQGAIKDLGVTPVDGAASVQPFTGVDKLLHGADNSLANDILKMDEEVDAIIKNFNPFDLSLSPKDKDRAIDLAVKKLERHENLKEVTSVFTDGKDFRIGYKTDKSDLEIYKGTFSIDDVGMWNPDQRTTKLLTKIWSPNFRLDKIRDDLVQTPHRGLLEGSKIKKSFDNFIRDGFKGMKKDEFAKVDQMLTMGSNNEKVYSYAEAVEQGVDGVKLTPKEYKGYMTVRKAFDALHTMKEKELIATKMAKGVRNVDLEGYKTTGRVYEYSENATSSYAQAKAASKEVLKEGEATGRVYTSEEIKNLYNQGYKLVRADANNYFAKSGSNYEWVLVKGENISDLSTGILGKVHGYLPRIREGGNFFLKGTRKIVVGGEEVKIPVTSAYSNNYSDLEAFRKTLDDADDFVVRADREMSREALAEDHVRIMGGLFTGGRKSEPLPYIGSGAEKLASPIKGLERYINSIARSTPMNLFREGVKQKWINTAKDAGVLKNYRGTESFNELFHKIDDTHEASRFFKDSHGEVAFMTGIPSETEKVFNANLIKAGKWLEKSNIPLGKKFAPALYTNKIQDVQSWVKGATYHAMLGMGNVAQLMVQGSGAVVALAANPVHGIKGLERALEFMVMDMIGSKAPAKLISKEMGNKVDLDCWKLWNESGMRENISNANIDYNSIFTDAPYDAGIARKILSNSDFFVKSGEMFYSRVAFGTAYDYYKTKLGRTPDINDLPAIIDRAEDYRMNMSRANTAKFQRGVMSIPTQFLQVQTKFIEKMRGSDLTTAEKSRLLAAQVGLYGSAGVPLFGTITPWFLDSVGVNAEEYDEEELRLINKGVIGHLLTTGMDIHTDFGGRVALGSDLMERFMVAVMGEGSYVELLAGPSFEWWNHGTDIWETFATVNQLMLSADDIDSSMMIGASSAIAKEFADIPSSLRNAIKGYTMYNSGIYRNKAGKAVFEYEDNNLQTSIFQAIGLSSDEVTDWYELGGTIDPFSSRKAQDSTAKALASLTIKMIGAGADEQKTYAAAYNALRSSIGTSLHGEKVMKQYTEMLKSPTQDWNSQMIRALKHYQDELQTGVDALQRARIRTNERLAGEIHKHKLGGE